MENRRRKIRILRGLGFLVPVALLACHASLPLRRAVLGLSTPFARAGERITTPVVRAAQLSFDWLLLGGDAPEPESEDTAVLSELARVELEELRDENRELRALLALPAPEGWHRVTAPVVARSPVTWYRSFRIGRGSLHGIGVGDVVLARTRVVGRVADVTPSTALVRTIADPGCRLSVRLPRADAVGVLSGRYRTGPGGAPVCLVEFLPRDRAYEVGETVVTSGVGGEAPGGLAIGQVMPWQEGGDAAYAELLMAPPAALTWFRVVAVMARALTPPPVPQDGEGEAP
jgi:rod shape-determining protein MreC